MGWLLLRSFDCATRRAKRWREEKIGSLRSEAVTNLLLAGVRGTKCPLVRGVGRQVFLHRPVPTPIVSPLWLSP